MRRSLLLAPLFALLLFSALAGGRTLTAQSAGTPLRRVDWPAVLAADPAVSVLDPGYCFPAAAVTVVCVDVSLKQPQARTDQGTGNPDISGYISVPDIKYGDLDGDGQEEAVLVIESGATGGAFGYLIYHQAAPQPQLLVISSGYKIDVTLANGRLNETDPFYFGFEGNCCPTALWRTSYTLVDGALQQASDPGLYLLLDSGEELTSPAAATVFAYYRAINQRSLEFAYSLLSPAAQQEMPFGSWEAGFATTTAVTASVTPITGTHVAVTITATDTTASGDSRSHTFDGTRVLVTADSAPLGFLLHTATIQ